MYVRSQLAQFLGALRTIRPTFRHLSYLFCSELVIARKTWCDRVVLDPMHVIPIHTMFLCRPGDFCGEVARFSHFRHKKEKKTGNDNYFQKGQRPTRADRWADWCHLKPDFLTNMSNLHVPLAKDNLNFSIFLLNRPGAQHTKPVPCDWVAERDKEKESAKART